jgi:hypothetical protein
MKFAKLLFFAWFLAWGIPGLATASDLDAQAHGGLSLGGFGTLGLARSDRDTPEYVRDLSQPRGLSDAWSAKIDSVLGIQAGYRFSDNVDGVVQALTRYRYDGSHEPEISWAFLRYDPGPNLSLRLGRLGTEFFMLADSRLVGYANLTVRPPPDFYDSLVFSYLDGVDVSATWPVGGDLLRAKLYGGLSPERTPFIAPYDWDLDGSPILGGHVDYISGAWQFRLGHARIRFNNEVPFDTFVANTFGLTDFLAHVPSMATQDTWSGYTSLGLVYEHGPLHAELMLNEINHDTESYEDGQAGYVIAAYRLGAFTPYFGYSRVKTKANRSFAAGTTIYDAIAAELTRQTHSDQHTTFLGIRWDVRPNVALKGQIDRVSADPSSLFPFREGEMGDWKGKMTIYSVALDFTF